MEYKCDLCGSTKYIFKKRLTRSLGIQDEKFRVVSCKSCKLHSIHPIPNNNDFERIYEKYAEKGNRINVEKRRIKNIYPQKLKLIKNYFKNAETILDIGSGIGGFVSTAIKKNYKVVGLELESEQVLLAKRIFGVDLNKIKFEDFVNVYDQKFDVVHMHHVFEHVQFPSKILFNIKNILNPNGIVIIEVPNQFFNFPNQLYFKLHLRKYKKPYNPYHHLYFYSKHTLIEYFNKTGFEIVYFRDRLIGTLSWKGKLKNILARLFNLSTSNVLEVVAKIK